MTTEQRKRVQTRGLIIQELVSVEAAGYAGFEPAAVPIPRDAGMICPRILGAARPINRNTRYSRHAVPFSCCKHHAYTVHQNEGTPKMLDQIEPKSRKRSLTSSNIKTEVLLVTPEIAEAWLDQNSNNRKMSAGVVSKYMRDMRDGNWKFTGDPIRFDDNHVLIDGQHRLAACVKSGTPFETVVMYGFTNGARDVLDIGKSRNIADILTLKGTSNGRKVSSALRVLLSYKNDFNWSYGWSTSEIIDAFAKHRGISKSVGNNAHMPARTPLAALHFLHYIATEFLGKADKAQQMVEVFRNGVPTYPNDPIHLYRERVCLTVVGKHKTRQDTAGWTLFYAWNAFVDDRPMHNMRWQEESVKIAGLGKKLD